MSKIRTSVLALATIGSLAIGASNAQAGGFLGDLIEQVAPGVGEALDDLNDQLGNPVDHGAAAVLDYYVPGAGRALELYWDAQRNDD